MKRVTNGFNRDVTDDLVAWLMAKKEIVLADLYLIGEPDNPDALRVTNWESPLRWIPQGTFYPWAVKRGRIPSRVGLEVGDLEVELYLRSAAVSSLAASLYSAAQSGTFDNWPIWVWTAYMPTAGDCDTFGCSEAFGGRIGKSTIDRGRIKFECTSFLDVINQSLPNQLVELTNPMFAFEENPSEDYGFPYVPKPEFAV